MSQPDTVVITDMTEKLLKVALNMNKQKQTGLVWLRTEME